ncbi:hypothetical protein V8E36_007842 [Tilletia maclaganii]
MATPSFRIKLRLPPKDDGNEADPTSNHPSAAEDALSDNGSESGSDGANEDELDELVDEVEDQQLASSMSGTRKKGSSAQLSRTGLGTDTPSPGGSPSSKKRPLTTREQTRGMSLAELDALPAAKRRRAHQARGASGPGRGWRKGLRLGQKPKYEVPPEPERSEKLEKSSTPKSTPASKAKPKAAPPPPKGPPFKYPPVAPWRTVPPIKPINRIPQVIPTIAPLERTGDAAKKAPRTWTKRSREIMSLGGRPWSVPIWFGGPDRGYALNAERAVAASDKAGAGNLSMSLAAPDGRSTPGGTPAPSTPVGAPGGRLSMFGPGDLSVSEYKVAAAAGGGGGTPTPAPASTGGNTAKSKGKSRSSLGGASRAKSGGSGGGAGSSLGPGLAGSKALQRSGSASAKSSPLTGTVPLPGANSAQPVGDWRGSSPAFFAGARKTG